MISREHGKGLALRYHKQYQSHSVLLQWYLQVCLGKKPMMQWFPVGPYVDPLSVCFWVWLCCSWRIFMFRILLVFKILSAVCNALVWCRCNESGTGSRVHTVPQASVCLKSLFSWKTIIVCYIERISFYFSLNEFTVRLSQLKYSSWKMIALWKMIHWM